jgi:glycerophosphoryl diester phosphodiesterase
MPPSRDNFRPLRKIRGMKHLLAALTGLVLMNVALAQNRVEVAAHRGESHDAPENTMASFNLAWQRGDDAAELDIHLSRDGRLIVSHDADLKRTAGVDLAINDHAADELRKIDVGKWKGERFAGEKLPFLDEVLATIPSGKRLFIEIKIGPEAVPPLQQALKTAGKTPEQTVIIGFNIASVRAAKKAMPNLKVYWLVSQKQDKQTHAWTPTPQEMIAKAKAAGVDGLDVSANPTVTRDYVKTVHDAGLELYVWTVDDPARARELAEAGVNGITTNRAAWLKELLRAEH